MCTGTLTIKVGFEKFRRYGASGDDVRLTKAPPPATSLRNPIFSARNHFCGSETRLYVPETISAAQKRDRMCQKRFLRLRNEIVCARNHFCGSEMRSFVPEMRSALPETRSCLPETISAAQKWDHGGQKRDRTCQKPFLQLVKGFDLFRFKFLLKTYYSCTLGKV